MTTRESELVDKVEQERVEKVERLRKASSLREAYEILGVSGWAPESEWVDLMWRAWKGDTGE